MVTYGNTNVNVVDSINSLDRAYRFNFTTGKNVGIEDYAFRLMFAAWDSQTGLRPIDLE